MSQKIQSIRGMHDVLPADTAVWQRLESILLKLMLSYGYQEIRLPLLEKTELFARSIGDVTDIVEKEMYTFADRNGDSLSLRPEGTASCVRAGIQHGFLHNQVQRLWYMGTMYRHERPQKGRYREFRQLGVEAFGMAGPDIDAELILMSARLWKALGLHNIQLEINTLGTSAERKIYRQALLEYFTAHQDQLDSESQARLQRNPLRILDSKNPAMQEVVSKAPALSDFLQKDSADHFAQLLEILDRCGIAYKVNPRLVRGLDYYNLTVFEWVTDQLGAQGTICAGGRYDGLVTQLGGSATPAIGFAMGLERILALLQQDEAWNDQYTPSVYVVVTGTAIQGAALNIIEALRNANPKLPILYHCGGGSLKSQLKRADKSGADVALIIGDDELNKNLITLKPLRSAAEQTSVAPEQLATYIQSYSK